MPLNTRWHKVLGDLWGNKTRTALIVLSIAVGLLAVGTIVSSREILSVGVAQSYAAINPSTGAVHTAELFDDGFVQSVRKMREVADADARRVLDVRARVGDGEWVTLTLFAIQDYEDIRVNKVFPQSGDWPPAKGDVLIERAALPLLKAQVGDLILVQTTDDKRLEVRITGVAHDPAQMPAQIDNTPYGYISYETLDKLGEVRGLNELYVVSRNSGDKEYARQVVILVKDKVERSGMTIPMSTTAEPGQFPLSDILDATLALMGLLGIMSLFLSTFLIVNTVSALLAQQRRQIGVMKAVGARTVQIAAMYLGMVASYGLAALVISLPLSGIGARALSQFMASMLNFDLVSMDMPPQAIILQVAVGLLVPVIASLYPLIANLRITAAEAMSAYQVGKARFGVGLLDRLLSGANLWFARRVLLRPVLLSLRNIFRSKGRLALTLVTLTLAGTTFVSILSVSSTLNQTLDGYMSQYNFDGLITLERSYRTSKIDQEARLVPGVVQTGEFYTLLARRVRPDGSESDSIYLISYTAGNGFYNPKIEQGRTLLPGDENALVVSQLLFKDEPDLHLNSDVVLKLNGRERKFHIVGVCFGMMYPMIYANYPYISSITGSVGRTDSVMVRTEMHDEASQTKTSEELEAHLERAKIRVQDVKTLTNEIAEGKNFFGTFLSLLLVMAFLLALVGGLGLMGTMSINVLERTREIGVLRAVGAPGNGVSWVFIREGIAIGLLSWLLGSLFAIPLGKALSDAVSLALVGTAQPFSYSLLGVGLWLLMVVILSAFASFLPARSASRLTVREVLAYE